MLLEALRLKAKQPVLAVPVSDEVEKKVGEGCGGGKGEKRAQGEDCCYQGFPGFQPGHVLEEDDKCSGKEVEGAGGEDEKERDATSKATMKGAAKQQGKNHEATYKATISHCRVRSPPLSRELFGMRSTKSRLKVAPYACVLFLVRCVFDEVEE